MITPKFGVRPDPELPYNEERVSIAADHVYTLPELIDLAERANPDTRIAWEEAQQAAFQVGIERASYLPQISAEVLAGKHYEPLPLPPGSYFIAKGDDLEPDFMIKWLLFDFGKREAQIDAAKELSVASNIAFTGAHQKLIFEVSKAYFYLDAVRAQLRVAEDALKNANTLLDAAGARRRHGFETITEVTIARRGTAKAQYDLERARLLDNDGYHALLEAMGLTPTLRLGIESSSGRPLPKELTEEVSAYIDRATVQRPDVVAALAKVRASESEIAKAQAEFYPTLELKGRAGRNFAPVSIDLASVYQAPSGPSYKIDDWVTSISLNLSFSIYDGGIRQHNVSIANSKSAAAKEELIRTQDQAVRQVARAYDTMRSTLAEYNAALALVDAANTAYASALESYRNGVGTFIDAVTAETEKAHAESARAQAYAAALTAAATLAFSTGTLTSVEALNSSP